MKSTAARIASVFMLGAAMTLGGATAAQASPDPRPGECTWDTSANRNSIAMKCGTASGFSQFRASIKCTDGGTYQGPWRTLGANIYSAVGCASGTITNVGQQLR